MTSPFYQNTSFDMASAISMSVRDEIYQLFIQRMQPASETRMLDVGVTSDWSRPESNFFEKQYPWPSRLTCAGTEDASHLQRGFPGLRFVQVQSGERLPFLDGHFDLAFSNATLEHAGSKPAQRLFIKELARVTSRGFFVATPNRWFPIEFHTLIPLLHYLPRRWHRALLRTIGMPYWSHEQNLRLLSKRDLAVLIPAGVSASISSTSLKTNLILCARKS
jgi:hypothetical protein